MHAPDLELRHLATLLAVVDAGTFGRAADALGYTQSAVSQQVAALERTVGMPVFDRPKGPRRVTLTPAGELLAGRARRLLAEVADVADELDRLRRGVTGRIVLGTFQSASVQLLPDLVGAMRSTRPEVELGLVEDDDQDRLLGGLIEGTLDVTFTVDPPAHPDLHHEPLGADPFLVVTRAGELPGPTASVGDLDGVPMIGQNPTTVCQLLIDERLAAVGLRPDYVFRSQDNQAVQGMVRSGMGRAVMPSLAVDHDDPGVDVWPLDPPVPPRVLHLSWRVDRTAVPALDHLVGLARDVAERRLDPVPVTT